MYYESRGRTGYWLHNCPWCQWPGRWLQKMCRYETSQQLVAQLGGVFSLCGLIPNISYSLPRMTNNTKETSSLVFSRNVSFHKSLLITDDPTWWLNARDMHWVLQNLEHLWSFRFINPRSNQSPRCVCVISCHNCLAV